jgi:hypothetical protein
MSTEEYETPEFEPDQSNLAEQLDDLSWRLDELEASQQRDATPGYQTGDPVLLAYQQAIESGDHRAAWAIQQNLTAAAAQQALAGATGAAQEAELSTWAAESEQAAIEQVGNAEEWAVYRPLVELEAEQENWDGLSAQQAGNKLARIYKMVKADDADRRAKLKAQSMTGSGSRSEERGDPRASAIVDAYKQHSYEALIRG